MELHAESERKTAYAEAIHLKRQPLSQWNLSNLGQVSMRDMQKAQTMQLAIENFDPFCQALVQSASAEFLKLIERDLEWA